MKLLLKFILAASAFIYVSARCDNQCSGHGTCMTDDVCQCYDNFGTGLSHDSGDCSDRICPFEVAWVDTPDVVGHHHKYLECAGKGICDRSSGECACFDGYEGKACARAACPNDCSGHGRCDYIEDLGYGATWNDWVDSAPANALMTSRTQSLFSDHTKTFDYHLWDKSKSRKCVCDATYGDIDCSKRLCPYGTDVLDTKDDTYYGLEEQKHQEQTILFASLTGDFDGLNGKSFALTFKSRLNETFTTIPIAFTSGEVTDIQNDVKLALLRLPNGVIDGVAVTVDFIDDVELQKLAYDNAVGGSFTATAAADATALSAITSIVGKLSAGCKLLSAINVGGNTDVDLDTAVVDFGGTTDLEVSVAFTGAATAAAVSATDVATTAGSTTVSIISATATNTFAVGYYITGAGIPPETYIVSCGTDCNTAGENIVISNAATATSAAVTLTGYDTYACTVNNEIVGRFWGDFAAGGAAVAPTSEFKILQGYLHVGCQVTGTNAGTNAILDSFTITTASLTAQVDADGFTAVALGCYKDLSYTTEGGVVRGWARDYSGNLQSGEDQTVIPSTSGMNHRRLQQIDQHRRRLANTALVTIKIRFTGPSVQGPQHLLTVEDYRCQDGCTPKLSGMPLETRQTSLHWSTIVELTKSDFNSYECGRRGKCDYATGLCSCFAGYVGDNCNTLTTLV